MTLEIKVGDELAFRTDYGSGLKIRKVDRITPSGRIICGPHTLNSNLTTRGESYSGPGKAYRVTETIRNEVLRQILLERIRYVRWHEQTTEVLDQVLQLAGKKP